MPIAKSWRTEESHEAWYPPGHGDFYQSFFNSGLLDEYIKAGKKYCFISNIDNLGATVDLNILNMLEHLCINLEKIQTVTIYNNLRSRD